MLFVALAKIFRLGRRGSVSAIFAVSALPMIIAIAVSIDFSRIAAARSALQQATDNAALAGASAYATYSQGDPLNAVARSVATSAFCNVTKLLPAGFAVVATSGSSSCAAQAGPVVAATIAGAKSGSRGIVVSSGCSATNTVVSGATCGFVVTVSASATMSSIFPSVLGATQNISVTSSAMNPFINIATALNSSFSGGANYADSIWVYPLLLDSNGKPAVTSSNPGALPDTSACTGDPSQTACGAYTMLASTNYFNCPNQTTPACTVNGTTFGPQGIVQNPAAGAAVITATTPLGIAFQAVPAGGYSQPSGTRSGYGYDRDWPPWGNAPPYKAFGDNCVWAAHAGYNTVSQEYSPSGNPIYPWSMITYWMYSSYLLQNMPPTQGLISQQLNITINPTTGYPYNSQNVQSTPMVQNGSNTPTSCTNPAPVFDYEHYVTNYPVTGNSNCALYIVMDPANLTPNSSYDGSCFNPASTPGQSYGAVSCQASAGHKFAFFWNDMGGLNGYDDRSYSNGIMVIDCSSQPKVKLIN